MSAYRTTGSRNLGQASLAPPGSLTDTDITRELESYRSAVASRYLPVTAGDINTRIGGGPYWVSPKLDGELWFLCRLEDGPILAAPNGRVIYGHLDILQAAADLPLGTILAGELHVTPPASTPSTIFVSSTSRDLKDERNAIRAVVEDFDMTYVGMEDFVPDEITPADYIREKVDATDMYVGIIGARYGHVEPGSGMSMTEIEYQQAAAGGKPLRIFVQSDDAAVPDEFRDSEPELVTKLQAFKERLLANHTCRIFTDLEDLTEKVRQTLATPSGRRGRVGDVGAALGGEVSPGPLAFAAFDVVSAGTLNALAPYGDRLTSLRQLLPDAGPLRVVPTADADGHAQINDAYHDHVVLGGAEGIVVRSSDGRTYKVKPTRELDAVIVAFTERQNAAGGLEARSILVALAHPEGGWVPITAVGALGDSAARVALHERLTAMIQPSAYRHASDNILYRFVEPSIVVEIRALDLQSEDSRGMPIKQSRLMFDPTVGWRAIGRVDSVTALSPVLQRLRTDKLPTLLDAGWRQLEPYLATDSAGSVGAGEASEVVRRQVWTKQGKDKVDVRKLLVWRTNKESTGDYPAYVVHWTDYSSTRKSPLSREVRLAPTEEAAMEIAEQMIASNVKKGWEAVDQ